jgi:hypothetical protein
MGHRYPRDYQRLPTFLAALTLVPVGLLLFWDAFPHSFPERAHDLLGAAPLAMIALAYFVYEVLRKPGPKELVKAVMLCLAFLFWSANQFWPNATQATLWNDIAVALFVFDVFLVIIGWPRSSPDEGFAESFVADSER